MVAQSSDIAGSRLQSEVDDSIVKKMTELGSDEDRVAASPENSGAASLSTNSAGGITSGNTTNSPLETSANPTAVTGSVAKTGPMAAVSRSALDLGGKRWGDLSSDSEDEMVDQFRRCNTQPLPSEEVSAPSATATGNPGNSKEVNYSSFGSGGQSNNRRDGGNRAPGGKGGRDRRQGTGKGGKGEEAGKGGRQRPSAGGIEAEGRTRSDGAKGSGKGSGKAKGSGRGSKGGESKGRGKGGDAATAKEKKSRKAKEVDDWSDEEEEGDSGVSGRVSATGQGKLPKAPSKEPAQLLSKSTFSKMFGNDLRFFNVLGIMQLLLLSGAVQSNQ